MTIVLDETKWAQDRISERSYGREPFETFRRVSRYYLDKGYKRVEVRNMLDSFLLQCDPCASLTKWSDTLDRALSVASKSKALRIDGVSVSRREMERIAELDSRQAQRLAFTLLCVSKYWDVARPNSDHWVNNRDSEIMAMANIKASIKRQSELYRKIKDAGLIQFSKTVDNTSVRVCFSDDGDVLLVISDFRNLGYQYNRAVGETNYFECDNCGIVSKINNPKHGRKQKYCKSCAAIVAMRQRVNSVMRQRGATVV